MNRHDAYIRALGGLTAACHLGIEGCGDAWPQYTDDGEDWTEHEDAQLRAAFAILHNQLAQRLERLERRT